MSISVPRFGHTARRADGTEGIQLVQSNARLSSYEAIEWEPTNELKLPFLLWICLRFLGLMPVPTGICCSPQCGRSSVNDENKGYGIASFLVLTSIVVCNIVDLYDIFNDYLGKQQDTVFLLSYLTYLPHLAVTLLFCLVGRLYISCMYEPTKHRIAVFSEDYLKARSEHGFGTLWWRFLGFMVLPTACIVMKFMVFAKKSGSINCPRDAFVYIRTVGGVAGYALYGCFCFVIHCLRNSHQNEFGSVAVNISQRGADEIENTKAEIRRLCFRFRSYCDFVGMWMMVSVSLAILGLVDLFWFIMFTIPEIRQNVAYEESALVLWTIFTWSDKTLFLLEPAFAVGGVDVGRPWRYFRESILQAWDKNGVADVEGQNSQSEATPGKDSKGLDEITGHMKLLRVGGSWIKTTLILSIISLYLGMTFNPTQDLDPWIGLACRPFNTTLTII